MKSTTTLSRSLLLVCLIGLLSACGGGPIVSRVWAKTTHKL